MHDSPLSEIPPFGEDGPNALSEICPHIFDQPKFAVTGAPTPAFAF
jgi:hypothetical protein